MTTTILILLVILVLFIAVAIILYRILRRSVERFAPETWTDRKKKLCTAVLLLLTAVPGYFLGLTWVIAVAYFVLAKTASDLLALLLRKTGAERAAAVFSSAVPAVVVTVAVMVYGYINMMNVVRTPYSVETAKSIRPEGYRVVMLSDLHYGISLDDAGLSEVAERIKAENADFIILDGDLVDDGTTREQMETVFSILGQIPSRYGTFFIFGNHDRPRGSVYEYTEEELINAVLGNGMTIIQDETVLLESDLALIGRDDNGFSGDGSRSSFPELTSQLDRSRFWLVLDHKPLEFDEVREGGGDLILCGHTHACQIWPAEWISDVFRFNDLAYGIRQEGTLTEIVSSGIGGWGLPIRTERHSEYVVLTLRHA